LLSWCHPSSHRVVSHCTRDSRLHAGWWLELLRLWRARQAAVRRPGPVQRRVAVVVLRRHACEQPVLRAGAVLWHRSVPVDAGVRRFHAQRRVL
jgi:hypothetical protein